MGPVQLRLLQDALVRTLLPQLALRDVQAFGQTCRLARQAVLGGQDTLGESALRQLALVSPLAAQALAVC